MSHTEKAGSQLASYPTGRLTHSLAEPRAGLSEQVAGYRAAAAIKSWTTRPPRDGSEARSLATALGYLSEHADVLSSGQRRMLREIARRR